MGILQGVANKDTVLIGLEDGLTLQDDTSHAVDGGGYYVTRKLTDVLVTLRAEIVALILVESEVELCSVLDDRTVERREQHMVLVVELRNGNNQQTVILARVTVYQRRRTISARTVCTKQFTTKGFLQVGHDGFF
jgi:hypothetical protein